MEPSQSILSLPLSVVSKIDVLRLLREIEAIDEALTQAAIRQPGTKVKLPKTSRLMDEITQVNKLNLLREVDRKRIVTMMVVLHKKAPLLHISFGADPSPLFVQRLMTWLRSEIHPLVLIQIGLQPNIGAGCTIRTDNHYFDFSLRQNFKKHRQVLIRELQGATK